MFFNTKKKTEDNMPLLKKENIILNCDRMEKNEAIKKVGKLLSDSGYVNENYIEGMLERETTFSTNIGNGVALPHGTEKVKKEINASGIAVLVCPNGTDWGGEDVNLIIGIAGKGNEHLEILSNIAMTLMEKETVESLINGESVDIIYDTFTKEA